MADRMAGYRLWRSQAAQISAFARRVEIGNMATT